MKGARKHYVLEEGEGLKRSRVEQESIIAKDKETVSMLSQENFEF